MPLSPERKAEYFTKMKDFLGRYNKCFVVEVDNVGSKQLQDTRSALRGEAEILMGKNTMMRKCIKEYVDDNPGSPIGQLGELCRGNVGFVFTNGDLGNVREALEANVRPAPARVGAVAPSKVVVPKGPTGCDPGQTNFFQTLQIGTKITKGQIEITNDVDLIEAGEKVTASQAALLQKLNIEPFTYGLLLKQVYDNGSLFDAKVLDITDEVLTFKFGQAIAKLASLSLAIGFHTHASVPHSIANAFKALLAVTVNLETYTFTEAEPYKALVGPSTGAADKAEEGGDAAEEAAAEEAPAAAEAAPASDY